MPEISVSLEKAELQRDICLSPWEGLCTAFGSIGHRFCTVISALQSSSNVCTNPSFIETATSFTI